MKMLTIAAAVLLLAGCATEVSPQRVTPPNDIFSVSRESANAPDSFRDGVQRTSCGEFELGHGQSVPTDATACLIAAVSTANAELAVTRLTVEGDPIVMFYRTTVGSDAITAFHDNAYDSYSDRGWFVASCTSDLDVTGLPSC